MNLRLALGTLEVVFIKMSFNEDSMTLGTVYIYVCKNKLEIVIITRNGNEILAIVSKGIKGRTF